MRYRRSRLQRVMKWVGWGVSVAVATVCAASFYFDFVGQWKRTAFSVSQGQLLMVRTFTNVISPRMEVSRVRWPPGSMLGRLPLPMRPFWDLGRPTGTVTCPLWLLFILVAAPTLALWYRDRRPPPGHCQSCGYDLTGNTSGRCPECGEAL